MKLTIKSRILLFIVIPTILIYVLSNLIFEQITYEKEIESIDKFLTVLTKEIAHNVDNQLSQIELIAQNGAEFVSITDEITDEKAYQFLKNNLYKNTLILGSRFAFEPKYYNNKLKLISATQNSNNIKQEELSHLINYTKLSENWYNIPKSENITYWDEPFIDRESKILCSRVSVPIIKNGQFIGVSSVIINLTNLKTLINRTLYRTLNFVIVSKTGRYIYHPNHKHILNDNILNVSGASVNAEDTKEEGLKMLKGESGKAVLRIDDEKNEFLWAYYTPISIANWSISVAIKQSELLQFIDNRKKLSIIIGGLGIISLFGFSFFLSRKLSTPIINLNENVKSFKSGENIELKKYRFNDEIGTLAKSFVELKDIILKKENELKSINKRLNFAFQAANTGIFDWEIENQKMYFNERMYSIFGYEIEEFIPTRQSMINLIAEEDQERFINSINKAAKEMSGFSDEFLCVKKNGENIWILIKALIVETNLNNESSRIVGTYTDITDRKKYEKEIVELNSELEKEVLKRTTELKKALAELEATNNALNSTAMVSISNLNGKITYINELFCEVTKYNKSELLGKSHNILSSNLYDSMFWSEFWNSIKSKKIWRGEVKNKTKNGDFFWVDTVVAPVFNEFKEHSGYLAVRFDITEKKRIENEIVHLLLLSDRALELTKSGFWDININELKYFNQSEKVMNILGIEISRGCKHLISDWLESIKAVSTETAKHVEKEFYKTINGISKKFDVIYALKRVNDNKVIWCHSVGVISYTDENQKTMYGVTQDITVEKLIAIDLESAIENSNKIISNSPIPMAIVDESTEKLILVNYSMHNFHKVSEAELLTNKLCDLFDNTNNCKLKDLLEGNDKIENHLITGKRLGTKEQRELLLSVKKIVYKNTNAYVVSFLDITDLKKAQLELESARSIAEAANNAKSRFLATVSHEIRTPMNAILGLSDLILKTNLDKKQLDYFKKIEKAASKLLVIINDILDFSKIETDSFQIENSEFDLEQIMDLVSNAISRNAQTKGLEFSVYYAKDVPLNLIGDGKRVNQILNSFCNNALKFTEKGEIVVSITLQEKIDNKVKLCFAVRDTGIGLKPEEIEKIFKSFSQVDNSTTRKFGGTGLGLVISKRLAELMGGSTWVKSKHGEGSTFYFDAWFEMQTEQKKDQFIPTIDLRGLKVLVCDDNETAREILREALETFLFKVTLSESGKQALELIKKEKDHPYELVLMDWKMPEMDGLEVSEKIYELDGVNAPIIIMVTAFGREEVAKRAKEIGIKAFLNKPVSYSSLFDSIMESFGKERRTKRIHIEKGGKYAADLDKIKHARILLTEDNDINQLVATELLESAGLIVEIANNGQEAVDKVKNSAGNNYDLVFMDLQMPIMDGISATQNIRKMPEFNGLPIVAMTADVIMGIKEKCFEAGMQDFITKPINPDEFFNVIIKWIKTINRHEIDEQSHEIEKDTIIELPVLNYTDINDGLKRVGGNKKLYLNLLEKFYTKNFNIVSEVKAALKENDYEKAVRLIHTIKGVSGNLGAIRLNKASTIIEQEVKNNNENIVELLDEYNVEIALTLNEIEDWFRKKHGKNEIKSNKIGEYDNVKLTALLNELKQLLKDNDFDSGNKLEEILSMDGIELYKDQLVKLSKLISDYRYDDANEFLEGVLKTNI